MKKLLLAIISVLVLTIVPYATASADSNYVEVSGVITNNQQIVRNAKVVVTCDGHSQTVSSNHFGDYSAYFAAHNCTKGSIVTVSADKGSASGEGMGTVSNTCVHVYVNVPLMTANLPELTIPTAIAALSLTITGYFLIRRKYASASIKK